MIQVNILTGVDGRSQTGIDWADMTDSASRYMRISIRYNPGCENISRGDMSRIADDALASKLVSIFDHFRLGPSG